MAPPSIPTLTPDQCTAMELVCARKFHQSFTLPATETHGPLRVTFAIAGLQVDDKNGNNDDVPTILWCGPAGGVRWEAIDWDHLAAAMGVRILVLDRPGIGGSTAVPLSQRLSVFVETVPLLLKHLNISKIHLAAHSAGTIYALNVLGYLPDLLCPNNPTITLFAPWIHQSHTGSSFFLRTAAMLPNKLFDKWASFVSLVGVVYRKLNPICERIRSHLKKKKLPQSREEIEADAEWQQESFGCTDSVWNEIFKLSSKFVHSEALEGQNDEIRLCLKTAKECNWGFCEDYPEMAKNLWKIWDERFKEGKGRLTMLVWYGEKDCFVGEAGKEYFVNMWKEAKGGPGLWFYFVEYLGLDHGSVANLNGFRRLFEIVKGNGDTKTSRVSVVTSSSSP